jgi:hypothetical protein
LESLPLKQPRTFSGLRAFAVAYLQAQKLLAAVSVDAHAHDNRAGADLERLAEPPVEICRTQVEAWVACIVHRTLQEGLNLAEDAHADAAHLRAGMPLSEPIAATRASTCWWRCLMTQASMTNAKSA